MDSTKENIICRLCLKIFTENGEPIEEILQHSLTFLSLCPNLAISDDPMLCDTCSVNLKKCFDFKARCLSTEDCIASFAGGEDKVDLRDVCSKVDENIDRVPDGYSVCRFCLELVKDDVSELVRQDVDLMDILRTYFLEMDLGITDEIIACPPCYNSLQFYDSFINNYLSVEEKINKYHNVESSNYKDLIDLRAVATFVSKSSQTKTLIVNVENIKSLIAKKVKHEDIVSTDVSVKGKLENPISVEQDEEQLIDYKEIQQKSNNSFQHDSPPSQSVCVPRLTRSKAAKHKCETVQEYNCVKCSFRTKTKGYLRQHMLKHKDASEVKIYKCTMCSYQAKRKHYLQTHMITHKGGAEVTMYKCDLCDYKTKWNSSLNKHKLTHKTRLQTTMYKCETCAYKTKHKNYLQQHSLTHMNKSEIKMLKCTICSFKTKWKSSFKKHQLSHRNAPGMVTQCTTYKCDLCDYEAKRKCDLNRHKLIHKTQSEITMYKCDQCNYKTKRNSDLKRHTLNHKTCLETALYKCEKCAYETKHKNNLQKHKIKHKNKSEVKMHKCGTCPFETKWKNTIRRHQLCHKNTPDVVT